MIKKLLKEAFEKAGELTGNESVNGRATYLADLISEDHRYAITAKSLTRYYKEESSPKPEVRIALAKFLGYEDYEDYVIRNSGGEENVWLKQEAKRPEPPVHETKKQLKTPILILLAIFGLGITSYYGFTASKQDCIVWVGDHYEATACSGDRLERPFDEKLLKNFKKLSVTDTTTFFKNGRATIWYDKSNKELEFFTAPGIHPENGKTLKPITQYMIDKYIISQ